MAGLPGALASWFVLIASLAVNGNTDDAPPGPIYSTLGPQHLADRPISPLISEEPIDNAPGGQGADPGADARHLILPLAKDFPEAAGLIKAP